MAKKASTDSSEQRFNEAQAQIRRIPVDHSNSEYNIGVGLNNYVGSIHYTLNEMVAVINEMSDRLERVETMLQNLTTGPLSRTLR